MVVAATVTYGDRAGSCLTVVRRALDCGAAAVVIVDNGSVAESSASLLEAARADLRIHLVRNERNEGSASGFSTAIASAIEIADSEWLWLLDDDNLPRPDALSRALGTAQLMGIHAAVACLRSSDPLQMAVADGAPVSSTLALKGSFLGFDLAARLRPPPGRTGGSDVVEIPWAPYGGLLVRASAAAEIDPPYVGFVLYGDDRDWCARLRLAGTRVFLDRLAVVDDLIDRWSADGQQTAGGVLERMIRSGDARRAFYLIRNTTFEDVRAARSPVDRVRLVVNFAVYTGTMIVTAARVRRPGFIPLFVRAVVSGVRGRWYPSTR